LKKAEAIIDFCEPGGQEIGRTKILTINGIFIEKLYYFITSFK